MTMPGFTAEVALRPTGGRYRVSSGSRESGTASGITPASDGFHYIGTLCYHHETVALYTEVDGNHTSVIAVPIGSC